MKAVNIMSNIAAFINESKRRKDIGKYFVNILKIMLVTYRVMDKKIVIYKFTPFLKPFPWQFGLRPFYALSVDKYRAEEDKTLTRRIAKFNMHSINKKSTRMSQRIFSSLGMEPTVRLGGIFLKEANFWIRFTTSTDTTMLTVSE